MGLAATIALWLPLEFASASEFQGSHASLGFVESFAGWPLPPGFYARADLSYRYYGSLANATGDRTRVNLGPRGTLPLKYNQSAYVATLTLFYIFDDKLPYLDATFGFGAYQPYVISRREAQVDVRGVTTGSGETRRGFGDTFIFPAYLGWRVPAADLGIVVTPLTFIAPTGQYNETDPIGNSIGRNYWSWRPEIGVTYLNKTGQEASFNFAYLLNSRNPATDYLTGQEAYVNYALMQHFPSGLSVGASGYYYRQITDDRQHGIVVNTVRDSRGLLDPLEQGPGDRGEVFAIGPNILYQPNDRLFLNFHWNHEVLAYDRAKGDLFYLRAAYRF